MSATVLVTGADQHQGLAVIRGLGLAGLKVVAGSPKIRSLGGASRFAAESAVYTSPVIDANRFASDVMRIVERRRIDMIIPVDESSLVALDAHRAAIEKLCCLAAPPSEVLAWAIDKSRTMALAARLGVPVPRTLVMDDVDAALAMARDLSFPVALKPRGHALHAATRHHHGFKVRYARSWEELRQMVEAFRGAGTLPLIQEYVTGTGICVSTLFDRDRPVALLPYARLREVPLTGGISVLRETLPLDERLRRYTVDMLQELGWQGMAMAEFKYDRERDRYVLMEVNGRFQASTALSLDAGINFPELTYRLYAGLALPLWLPAYRVGLRERWLRGDILSLLSHLSGATATEAVPEARRGLPGRLRAVRDFIAAFRPGIRLDEFKWYDPLPGVMESVACVRVVVKFVYGAVRRALRARLARRARPKTDVRLS